MLETGYLNQGSLIEKLYIQQQLASLVGEHESEILLGALSGTL